MSRRNGLSFINSSKQRAWPLRISRPQRLGSIVSDIQLFTVSARALHLKVDAQDKVDFARGRGRPPGGVDAAKVRGVKVQRIENKIGVIERVEEVDFEFHVTSLIEARPFGETEIHLS